MEPSTGAEAAGSGSGRDGGVPWPSIPAAGRRYGNRITDRAADEWTAVDRTASDELTPEAWGRKRS